MSEANMMKSARHPGRAGWQEAETARLFSAVQEANASGAPRLLALSCRQHSIDIPILPLIRRTVEAVLCGYIRKDIQHIVHIYLRRSQRKATICRVCWEPDFYA